MELISRKFILTEILKLEKDIIELYKFDEKDYRGNIINREYVLDYFYKDLYRCVDIIYLILSYIKKNKKQNTKLLDVGIGYGFYSIVLKNMCEVEIIGTELEENISVYGKICKKYKIELLPLNLSSTNFEIGDKKFDIIIISEVVEHLQNIPLDILRKFYKILDKDGILLLTTPNSNSFTKILKSLFNKTDYSAHIKEYNLFEIKRIMKTSGFKNIKANFSYGWNKYNKKKIKNKNFSIKIYNLLNAIITKFIPPLRDSMFFIGYKNGDK